MNIPEKVASVNRFLNVDIWKRDYRSEFHPLMLKALKVFMITIKEINKDQIALKSSALTYLTILSVVPLLALVFGISKGFGFAINLQQELANLFPAQEVVMTTTFELAQKMLDNAKGGVIAGVSTIILIFTVMRLLNNVEDVFNSIWGKQTARTWIRKFTDYLAILIVGPTLMVLSSSTTVFLTRQIRMVGEKFEMEFYSAPLAVLLFTISPYILIWALYTMVYVIMPNRKVSFRSGLYAGILAGTIFQLTQWGFINISIFVARYNAIYGSLAALPLFFIFTQLSWTIVFIGGEFSYALEKVDEYIPDERNIEFSAKEKKRIALAVTRSIAIAFEKDERPYTKRKLAEELGIPHRFVSDAINKLVTANVLIMSQTETEVRHVYTPAKDINQMCIKTITDQLDESGESDLFTKNNEELKNLFKALDSLDELTKESSSNKLIKDT
ncbi:MAG: YihY/virulence factor BrkB family protein [Reichenbachiella sp.]